MYVINKLAHVRIRNLSSHEFADFDHFHWPLEGKGFGGLGKGFGKDIGKIGKTINHASRDAGRTVNHAGDAINHFSHQAAHVADRTANQAVHVTEHTVNRAFHASEHTVNQAVNVVERTTNQAVEVTERTSERIANQAAQVTKRAAIRTVNDVERTANQATHFTKRSANKLRDDARHAAYVTGDCIVYTANEIGDIMESIDLHDRNDNVHYCHHCRCHRAGCRCDQTSYYWYGYSSNSNRNRYHRHSNWSYQSPQTRSSYSNTPSSNLSTNLYSQPFATPNRDDEFNSLYSETRNETIDCARPTCNEWCFGTGNWISARKLELFKSLSTLTSVFILKTSTIF